MLQVLVVDQASVLFIRLRTVYVNCQCTSCDGDNALPPEETLLLTLLSGETVLLTLPPEETLLLTSCADTAPASLPLDLRWPSASALKSQPKLPAEPPSEVPDYRCWIAWVYHAFVGNYRVSSEFSIEGVPVGPVFLLGLLVPAIVAACASRAVVTLSATSFLMAA
ncbi:hypothetical protein Tco_0434371 [Tanacetum coccineum]